MNTELIIYYPSSWRFRDFREWRTRHVGLAGIVLEQIRQDLPKWIGDQI